MWRLISVSTVDTISFIMFSLCCVCEVGWLPIVQVFVAALRRQPCFCIKTIQSEAKASAVISSVQDKQTSPLSIFFDSV